MIMREPIWRIALSIAIGLGVLPFFIGAASPAPQGKGLSLIQIEKLIQIHTPDDIVAKEIRTRGVDFLPTPRMLDELGKRGAGDSTLAAVRERMPVGTIEISGPANSRVLLDGDDKGVLDSQGRLQLTQVPAGHHDLKVDKPGYRPAEISIVLSARDTKRLPVQLEWAGGFLTIHADPAKATIEISGFGQFNSGVTDLQCPAGTYEVRVSLAGFKAETRTVSVAAGQHANVDVHLDAYRQYVENKLGEAKQRLARDDPRGAIQICNSLLSSGANSPEVSALLASSYWRANDATQFTNTALPTIREGAPVDLDVVHEHLEASGEAIHPAKLTLSSQSLTYDPGVANCKYRSIRVPLANVEIAEVSNKATSGIMVVRHLTQGTYLLHLEVRDPAKSDKKLTLYFALPDARIERGANNVAFLASLPGSSQMFAALANLIVNLKAETH